MAATVAPFWGRGGDAKTEGGDATDQGSASAQRGAGAERYSGVAQRADRALDREGISRPRRGGRPELGDRGGAERGGARPAPVRGRRHAPSGSSVAGLGGGREGAARPRRDAAAAMAGISEPTPGRLPLHPVLRAFPRLAATFPAADDAPAASRRRGARSRLRRHDAGRHRQGRRPPGAGLRCLPALLGPDLRRGELDPRS